MARVRGLGRIAPVVLVALASGLAAVAVQRNLFPFYTADADEPVYRFQGRMLLDGKLNLPMSQVRFFNPWLGGRSAANGRLVMAFTWGWPAVLAVSEWVFHSMLVAVAVAAALATTGCYLLAREILDDHPRALTATVLFAACPFVLVLSGTYLNYVFAVGVELFAGWMLLRGLRVKSRWWLVGSGLLFGLTIVIRPYDALLAFIPFGLYVIVSRWRRWRDMARIAVPVMLGALPAVALALGLNIATTGSALLFPTPAQSGGGARFFWGRRGIIAGHDSTNFGFSHALVSTWANIWGFATWPLGTLIALAVAVFGGVALWRQRRDRLWLLIAMFLVFPIGYIGWFAIALSRAGAVNGLGPHYYLPAVAPLSMLTAHGGFELWARRRRVRWFDGALALGAAGAVVLSVLSVQSKLAEKRPLQASRRSYLGQVATQLAPVKHRKVLLEVEPSTWYQNVMGDQPNFANTPTLDGRVLYAVDRGPAEIDLLREQPDRAAYRIVRRFEPGTDIRKPQITLKPLRVESGPVVDLQTTIDNTSGDPIVTAYLGTVDSNFPLVLDRASTRGKTYQVTWRIAADGTVSAVGDGSGRVVGLVRPSGVLADGATFAAAGSRGAPDAVERRYEYRLSSTGTVQLLSADQEWVYFGSPFDRWLPIDVSAQLDVGLRSQRGSAPGS